MCGIAALLGIKETAPLAFIKEMTDAIRHRGPDDEGMVFFHRDRPEAFALGGPDTPPDAYQAGYAYAPTEGFQGAPPADTFAAFGHRRLSIVDLSPAGHQPMCAANGRYWITYNGEIYNYQELRAELEALGHRFVSSTDTEVILAAYAEWGKDCLDRFNGMWAFVLADLEGRKFFGARDRFGVKPLYYWASPEGFVAIASEIKQFTVLPGWEPVMNLSRTYDFLHWGITDHTAETLFQGVYQLRGGEAFEVGFDALGPVLPVYRWYELKPAPFSGTLDEAAQRFQELLRDSVRLRLRSDVPVGSCLSGGLDSTSIVCLANDLLREGGEAGKQRTFSAYAEVPRFDERTFIQEVVEARQIEGHHTVPSLKTLFDTLDAMTWHQDEPFGSSSIYAQWNVFKLASEHRVKVMLDGQGADEALAGYHGYFGSRLASLFKHGRWGALAREIRAVQQVHGHSPVSSLKKMANVLMPDALLQPLRGMLGVSATTPAWLGAEAQAARTPNPIDTCLGGRANTVRKLSFAQLTATNLPMLLHWEDRDSMAHAIESRVPFLDYRLVEFALGLPEDFKLSEGVTKRVLREGMRGIIPERIRTRMDKLGFATPEEVWVREDQPEAFREHLSRAIAASQGILQPEAERTLERMIAGEEPFSFWIWRLISFGRWVERFGVKKPAEAVPCPSC